jgi:hypothetical protein
VQAIDNQAPMPVYQSRMVDHMSNVVSNAFYTLRMARQIAPYNTSSPNVLKVWKWERTEFFNAQISPNKTPSSSMPFGATMTGASDIVFGATSSLSGLSVGSVLLNSLTPYLIANEPTTAQPSSTHDDAPAVPFISKTQVEPAFETLCPKDGVYRWTSPTRALVNVDWAGLAADKLLVRFDILWRRSGELADNYKAVLLEMNKPVQTEFDAKSTGMRTLPIPMEKNMIVSIVPRIFTDTGAAINATAPIEIILTAGNPEGKWIYGNTIPYTVVSYWDEDNGSYQRLQNSDVSFVDFYGKFDRYLDYDDPNASVKAIWQREISQSNMANVLNDMILQSVAFAEQEGVDPHKTFQDISGISTFKVDQFVPVADWILTDGPFYDSSKSAVIPKLTRGKMVRQLLLFVDGWAKMVNTDRS